MSFGQSTLASVMVGLLLSVVASSSPAAAQASQAGDQAATLAPATSSGREADAWFANYRFRSGETLDRVKIHYTTLGTPHRNAKGEIDNAILVLHWTGANGGTLTNPIFRKALFDPGRPLDATRYYLILPDSVGHGASSKPSDGQRTRFPKYDYGDMVDLQHKLVTETLGIRHLHAIVGLSMGGMNAWQWAEAYPDMMDGIMPIVSLPMPVSGRNLLWRRMAIDTIVSDPDWRNGSYTEQPRQWVHGYRVLRLMIDSASALQGEVPDAGAADRFLAETRVQAEHIDANDFLYSLRSSFSYNPEPQPSAVTTKVFALNFGDDEFNPDELQVLQRAVPTLRQGRYVVQPGTRSSPGHLTMTRPDLWAEHVGDFMRWLGDTPNEARR